MRHERVVVHDEVVRADAVGREARPSERDRFEGLPAADAPPLETMFDAGEDAGQERRAADEQHVVHLADLPRAVLEDLREARLQPAVETLLLEDLGEPRAREGGEARAGPGPGADDARPGRHEAEDARLAQVHRLLHAARLGEHEPPPEAIPLVALVVGKRAASLAAGILEDPAIDRMAAERPARLRDDARLAAHRPLRRQPHQHDVHRAAADVDDDDRPLAGEAESVAEGRRDRLIDEAHPAHAEVLEQSLHFRAVGLEGGDRRGDHEVADAMSGGVLRLVEHLAEERARRIAPGDRVSSDARERPQGFARQRRLEGGDEGGVDAVLVPPERLAPDERPPAEEHAPRDRRPAADAVEDAGALEEVHGGWHHARRLERIAALGIAADRGQLDQLGLPARLVPAGEARVRRAQVESPSLHRHHTLRNGRRPNKALAPTPESMDRFGRPSSPPMTFVTISIGRRRPIGCGTESLWGFFAHDSRDSRPCRAPFFPGRGCGR